MQKECLGNYLSSLSGSLSEAANPKPCMAMTIATGREVDRLEDADAVEWFNDETAIIYTRSAGLRPHQVGPRSQLGARHKSGIESL